MAAINILIALCFIPGYSLWESCGPYLPYSFAICSIPGESSIFSLNASFAPYEIYRSQNGGESWFLSTVFPSGVKYLSTDYCGRIMVGGLERVVISSDLGETWSDNFTYPNARVRNVSTDPSDSQHMLAAITELPTPLLESFNGGQTWAMPSSSPNNMQGKSVAFSPANPDLIFVAGNRNPISYVDVFRSTNGGTTWTDVFNYSYQPGSTAYVNIIAFENPDRAVLAAWDRIYTTDDGGGSWTHSNTFTGPMRNMITGNSPGSLYAILYNELYSSSDYGETWQFCSDIPQSASGICESTGGRLHLATNTGHYYSQSPQGPWIKACTGMPGGNILDLVENPFTSTGFPVFTGDYFLCQEACSLYEWGNLNLDNTRYVDRSHSDSLMFFAAGSVTGTAGFYRSTDGGNLWLRSAPIDFIEDGYTMKVSHETPGLILFAGGFPLWGAGIFRSDDFGDTSSWSQVLFTSDMSQFSDIEQNPMDQSNFLACGLNYSGNTTFFTSSDYGVTWEQNPICLSGVLTNDLLLSSTVPGRFLCATTDGVYSTEDGELFTRTLDHNAHAFETDPSLAGLVFVACDSSYVFVSDDEGMTWEVLHNFYRDDLLVYSLEIVGGEWLYAGTMGFGAFRFPLDCLGIETGEQAPVPAPIVAVESSPCTGSVNLTVPGTAVQTELLVFDVSGRIVDRSTITPSSYEQTVSFFGLSPGISFAGLSGNAQFTSFVVICR